MGRKDCIRKRVKWGKCIGKGRGNNNWRKLTKCRTKWKWWHLPGVMYLPSRVWLLVATRSIRLLTTVRSLLTIPSTGQWTMPSTANTGITITTNISTTITKKIHRERRNHCCKEIVCRVTGRRRNVKGAKSRMYWGDPKGKVRCNR